MTASVRLAGPNDAFALAELRWRWRVEEGGESGMERQEFTTAFAQWMFAHAASHTACIADVGGAPVGMAWLALVERLPGPGQWTRTAGTVQSVYVVPEQRGAGVGGLLVAATIDQAKVKGMQYLSVHPSERSFTLYRRAGFRESPGVLELRWSSYAP